MHLLTGLVIGEMLLGTKMLSRGQRPSYEFIHVLPGRLRLRVRGITGDDDRAKALEQTLGDVRGVKSARCDIRTGSVLLYFDDQADVRKAVIDTLEGATQEQTTVPSSPQTPILRRQLRDLGNTANKRVMEQTHGATDLGSLLAFAAGAWGLKTVILPGAITRWQGMTLLYWSYNMLRR